MATSFHSKEYFKATQLRQGKGATGLTEPEKVDTIVEEHHPTPIPLHAIPPLARLRSDPEDQQDENETEEETTPPPDNQTLLRLLEENEKVSRQWITVERMPD